LGNPRLHLGLFTFNPFGVVPFNIFLIDLPLYVSKSGKLLALSDDKKMKMHNPEGVECE